MLNHNDLHLKRMQHCVSTKLQLKKKKLSKFFYPICKTLPDLPYSSLSNFISHYFSHPLCYTLNKPPPLSSLFYVILPPSHYPCCSLLLDHSFSPCCLVSQLLLILQISSLMSFSQSELPLILKLCIPQDTAFILPLHTSSFIFLSYLLASIRKGIMSLIYLQIPITEPRRS